MVELCTLLETSRQGVIVLSGPPGVGKTSFLNIQQYLLETKTARYGPHVLAARHLCPIQTDDTVWDIALRVVHMLSRSIEDYCLLAGIPLPPETAKVKAWLSQKGMAGVALGLSIMGFGMNVGREVRIPNVKETTYEGLQDVIEGLVAEATCALGFSGVFIVLDNIENLDSKQTTALLMTFRDTLFTVPNAYWILIGQSGLGSLIQTIDPRVSERLIGSGLELKPIQFSELELAIDKRVKRFHRESDGDGKPPLATAIHQHLFDASLGEIRFVFKYGSTICAEFVKGLRLSMAKEQKAPDASTDVLDKLIGKTMVQSQIPDPIANNLLRVVVEREVVGMGLSAKDMDVLNAIGELGIVSAKHAVDLGFKSMQEFVTNYLTRMHKANLLNKHESGQVTYYRLRGIAKLGAEFGFFEPSRRQPPAEPS